jgi:hypothetical protein
MIKLLLQPAHLGQQVVRVVGGHLLGDLVVLVQQRLDVGHPSSTLPRTVLLSSSTGSWPSMPTVKPGSSRASR